MKIPWKYDKKCNIKYIKPLYYFGNILGITPLYDFDSKEEFWIKRHQVYSLSIALFVFIFYFYSITGVIVTQLLEHEVEIVEFIIEALITTQLTLINLISIIKSSYSNKESWVKMLRLFSKVDGKITRKKKRKQNIMGLEFVTQLIVFVILSLNCYVWITNEGMYYYQYYILEILSYTYIGATVVLIADLALCIKYRFEFFNEKLEDQLKIERNCSLRLNLLSNEYSSNKYTLKIDNLLKHFCLLDEIVNFFNQIFGIVILIFLGVALMDMLDALHYFLVYKNSQEENDVLIFTVFFLVTSISLTLGIIVIMCYDLTNREIYRTATLCYQLLLELPENSEDTIKLLYLTKRVSHRCPQLSAANVFDVNITTLFKLLGSLTSYVIVLIQFSK